MMSVMRHISGMTPMPVPRTIIRARQRMQRVNVHCSTNVDQRQSCLGRGLEAGIEAKGREDRVSIP